MKRLLEVILDFSQLFEFVGFLSSIFFHSQTPVQGREPEVKLGILGIALDRCLHVPERLLLLALIDQLRGDARHGASRVRINSHRLCEMTRGFRRMRSQKLDLGQLTLAASIHRIQTQRSLELMLGFSQACVQMGFGKDRLAQLIVHAG